MTVCVLLKNLGKDWGQEEKGTTEDEMVGWHHQLDGHGFGWTLGVGDGQGGLECCVSWGRKESDMTEWLNWTELHSFLIQSPVWLDLAPCGVEEGGKSWTIVWCCRPVQISAHCPQKNPNSSILCQKLCLLNHFPLLSPILQLRRTF